MTYEELKKDEPELYQQIYSEGVQAERARMQALDEMREPDDEEGAKIIDEAKYGDQVMTAEQAAVRILRAHRENRQQMQEGRSGYMQRRRKETAQMNDVRGGSSADNDAAKSDADEINAFAEMMKGFAR